MATEIDARIWFDQKKYIPEETFISLLHAISGWPKAVVEWQGIKITDFATDKTVLDQTEKLSTEEIEHLASSYHGSSLHWSTALIYNCWRFTGLKAEKGFLRLGVETWGNDYAQRHGRQTRLEGNASLWTQTVGPYCTILDEGRNPGASEVNRRVEDNLEDLTNLFFRVVDEVKPRCLKVFNDAGEFFPFNAHLAYYATLSQVVDDVRFIAEIWEQGLPSHNIPMLKDVDPVKKEFYFHPWRDSETRTKLKMRLNSTIANTSRVDDEVVQRVISSERFDIYNLPQGFAVLEYPHYFNAFLDRFYLEILDFE